ncbi:PAC2 family protein [Nocardioides mangrovicus]|uniref:PAC2 family protein n=1 Tax=Nocardioides mangrovicus TaxID=2478913 RepID=A0A3L8P1S2_9ACTN|nr:PAC2 family protein [Nocardioides mangrovicus]RLV49255.1 PAC2 family protein [Nocardioides mangrovicus]
MPQARFVHIVDEVPELGALPVGPVLVVGLDGFLDAGSASALAITYLLESDAGRVVASLEVDEFYDYRARRPAMTFHENHYTDYDAPRLVVRLLRDAAGTPYLLLTGPEPDIRWEGFAGAVRAVVEHFGVRLIAMLGSVPMAVPHTRPVQLTNHATDESLLVQPNSWRGEIRIPSSAQALLELRLGEWGHPVLGFVAHIPHYVAQLGYPQASVALLESIGGSTELTWDLTGLREAAERQAGEIEQQIADSEEVREVVSGLEQQYDAFHRAAEQDQGLLAEGEPLPSGDEIGAQFEQFLAGLDGDEKRDES